MSLLLLLYGVFFKVSLFTFGGGYAMITLYQSELVERHGFVTAEKFADLVAVAQVTPGPIGLNTASYVGYQIGFERLGGVGGGVLGSFVATLGLISPSLLVAMLAAMFLRKYAESRGVKAALAGIRPVVVGLIAAAVVSFAETSVFTARVRSLWQGAGEGAPFGIRWQSALIFALALAVKLIWKKKIGILPLLLGAGALACLLA